MKVSLFIIFVVVSATFALSGCGPQALPGVQPLYNETLNSELENLTVPVNDSFREFMFSYTPRAGAKYEFARDDLFSRWNESFTSLDVSVLGVMLGDNYTFVLEQLGVPDIMYVPSDRSYRNMEYGKKIGIGGKLTAITVHLENDTVTKISMRKSFQKYLNGETKFGQPKEFVYDRIGDPDYQDFLSSFKIYFYVEKGFEFYLASGNVDIISLVPPEDFKGVKYITRLEQVAPGVYGNVTKPVRIR